MLGIEWNKYIILKEERPELFINNGIINIVFDESIIEDYQSKKNVKIGVVYDSPYNMMVVDLVYNDKEDYYTYERVIPKVQNGAVVIIPKYNGKYVLLKQYRHAIRDYQYAFPRGFAEAGISAEDNVRKELFEEIGAKSSNIRYLGNVIADSGLIGNKVSVYECEIDSYTHKEMNEGIVDIVEVSYDNLKEMVKQHNIDDGFTLSAIALILCD